MSQQLLQIFSD